MRLTVHRFDLADPDRSAEHPALRALLAEGAMLSGVVGVSEGPEEGPTTETALLFLVVPDHALVEARSPWWWVAIPVAAAAVGLLVPLLTLWIAGP